MKIVTPEPSVSQTDPWQLLDAELQAWVACNQTATFWWRDDDAIATGPKLTRLVDLCATSGLLLAVIPARATAQLSHMLSDCSHVQVAQHGYAHINHAPRGQGLGAWELGLHRGEAAVLADLDAGRAQLNDMFESTFIPVVVPPWNRIAPELLKPITERQYVGVSAFGPCDAGSVQSGLVIANAHCDPIRWKSGATFAGETKTIMQLVEHLQARRSGRVNSHEHTGFLTHHIDLDSAGWDFCTRLASAIHTHPGASWVPPDVVFGIQS